MNIPFAVGRSNMDRLGFMGRARDSTRPTHNIPPRVDDANDDGYDDRAPLSPRISDNLEAQRTRPREDMAERSRPSSRFIFRFRPSFLSVASTRRNARPRPASSNYSGDGLPPDTVVNGDESPKTPQFRLDVRDLPSPRLHLPNLTRTWTQGSNATPSRPPTADAPASWSPAASEAAAAQISEPAPAVPAGGSLRTGSRSRRRRNDSDEGSSEPAQPGRRTRRRHHTGRSDRSQPSDGTTSGSSEGHDPRRRRRRRTRRHHPEVARRREDGSERPTPKRFLFCFPWIKSRRIRSQILRCFVSGLFLTLILAVYLSLSITKNINNSEFTVLLILIILFVTIFFCHGLIRLCMLVMRGGRENEDLERGRLPEMTGPGGYAMPRQPIRVVLARDEEAAGIESEATKSNPPAYGRWRESVRVDPDRIYWMRNDTAHETVQEEDAPGSGLCGQENSNGARRTAVARPPSYISEDGVSYVVEARPRSVAPTMDVPLRMSMPLHPSEAGRIARPPAW